ncbi:hypothetical protein ACT29H_10460 [Thermophagus sp. OGC60D27]
MFLVGITGSFLPYLFVLGMVFICSLDAPVHWADYALNCGNDPLPAHHPELLPVDTSEGSDYWASVNEIAEFSLKKCDRKEKGKALLKRMVCCPVQSVIWKIRLNQKDFLSSRLAKFYWSGLSPPLQYC